MKNKEYLFVALSPVGDGLSGGDRIFIEFARNLSKTSKVTIVTWKDGYNMCMRNGLDNSGIKFLQVPIPSFLTRNFLVCYVSRIVIGIFWAIFTSIQNSTNIIYSSSEFLMDVYPSIILKTKIRKSLLICTWFQTAPSPIKGYAEGKRERKYRLSALLYWISQKLTKPFISEFSDYVLVNNEAEIKQFPLMARKNRLFVVLGGVDVDKINNWKKKFKATRKIFDGLFQGRFHPQKGVVELIEIWGKVVKVMPSAKLVMIGDGPLMPDVKRKIKDMDLTNNVELLGFVFDGDKKYSIFSKSKIVVHPAFYDSGGMASAEAMMFGSPVVGFDLASYKSYYPKGMLKVKVGDLDSFAEKIIELLKDENKRIKIGKEGEKFVEDNLSWSKKTNDLFSKI